MREREPSSTPPPQTNASTESHASMARGEGRKNNTNTGVALPRGARRRAGRAGREAAAAARRRARGARRARFGAERRRRRAPAPLRARRGLPASPGILATVGESRQRRSPRPTRPSPRPRAPRRRTSTSAAWLRGASPPRIAGTRCCGRGTRRRSRRAGRRRPPSSPRASAPSSAGCGSARPAPRRRRSLRKSRHKP